MTLPAEVKDQEQCHHFPAGVTRVQNVEPRDRHKMLGNGWHIGVIKFLVWLMLAQIAPTNSCDVTVTDAIGDPLLSKIFINARSHPLSLSRELPVSKFVSLPPSDNEWEHWLMTADIESDIAHPLLSEPKVCQALRSVYDRLHSIDGDLHSFRESVLQSVEALVRKRKQSSTSWFAGLSQHVQAAYALPDSTGFLQIPVFLELLRGCGYPDVERLASELAHGIGHIRPMPGWLPRTDKK